MDAFCIRNSRLVHLKARSRNKHDGGPLQRSMRDCFLAISLPARDVQKNSGSDDLGEAANNGRLGISTIET